MGHLIGVLPKVQQWARGVWPEVLSHDDPPLVERRGRKGAPAVIDGGHAVVVDALAHGLSEYGGSRCGDPKSWPGHDECEAKPG